MRQTYPDSLVRRIGLLFRQDSATNSYLFVILTLACTFLI